MRQHNGHNDSQLEFRTRVRFLAAVVFVLAGYYCVHLFDLQVVKGTLYRKKADAVAQRIIPIPAQRGEIFDRNYDVPLVTNQPSFAVDIIPGETGQKRLPSVIDHLASILELSPEAIRKSIPTSQDGSFSPIEVKSDVPFAEIAHVAEHIDELPGVTWQSKPIREYLATGSISHVLGYVGDITAGELQVLYNKGYEANSSIGKSGVEEEYDSILRGKNGEELRVVDASGRLVQDASVDEIPPKNGKDIVLTIDRHMQTLAQRALGNRMGSVVILKPSTGEVLALVSYPWYNPNMFVSANGNEELMKASLDPHYPFLDRAIQSSYSPASTFKIIMTTAVIEENAFPLNKTIDTSGGMEYGGRMFHDWKPGGFGSIDLADALAESSDQFFWTMGTKYLGVDKIVEYAKRFGLGKKTGIDLPGEVAGLVPSPEWKEATKHQQWVGGDTMNLSIGQGYLQVTPIQFADVVAMVVNKGVVYVPHVLKEVRDPTTGKVIEEVKPKVLIDSAISPQTFEKVQAYMRGVITHGTANVVITTKAVKIAAKTGTGQVGIKDHYTSWFASFAPYDAKDPNDQIVVVVMVEATNPWQWWAPKAASIIYQGIFAHQDYEQAVKALEPVWYLNSNVVGNFDR